MSPEVQNIIKEVIKRERIRWKKRKKKEINTVEGIGRPTLQEQAKTEKTITTMMSPDRKRNLRMNSTLL
eukprot:3513682-Ditylum_brightwellii.AAC.1